MSPTRELKTHADRTLLEHVTAPEPAAWSEHEVAYAARIIQLLRLDYWATHRTPERGAPITNPIREKAGRVFADLFIRKALRFSMEMDSETLEAWAFAMEREQKKRLSDQV